jgi:hypothetical protein
MENVTAELLLALRLGLALLLYLFLGVAFSILWRGFRHHEKTPVIAHTPAHIVIEEGEEQGRRLSLRPVTAIGRSHTNILIIADAFASNHHALILWRDELWWLEDLESHNGTFLNEQRIAHPMPLASGDRIRIGTTTLRFETDE